MARDAGLEHLLHEHLGATPGLSGKAMFGGYAWLLDGHLLCGARDDGVLLRLGKGNDRWALERRGVVPMVMGERPMHGWVRVAAEAFGDDAFARELLDAALAFVRSLPPK